MGIVFSPKQQQVIDFHHRNLLVAAAAGAGKTAVLVERIVKMIENPESGIDIDRLLIVTFTKAAASEMRERIGQAIASRIEKDPLNRHLLRQETLLHNAQITTIDSFCLFVIRNNFNDIGLEPDFRVADEGEIKLLMQDCMEEMLEKNFAEGKQEFFEFIEAYCPDGKEKKIEEYILNLFQYAQSLPFPDHWYQECEAAYQCADEEELENSAIMQYVKKAVHATTKELILQMSHALDLCCYKGGPELDAGPLHYVPVLEEDLEQLKRLDAAIEYEKLFAVITSVQFASLPRAKNSNLGVDETLIEAVKQIRALVKEQLNELRSSFFTASRNELFENMSMNRKMIHTLIELTQQFTDIFQNKKKEKKLVDFSDMEHMAIQILLKEENGEYIPTDAAKEYQNYFEEILVDEYQDSNLVQEYLLESLARKEKGKKNRFMVGDVKQSIYKFRLARPEIFMEKFGTYSTEESEQQKIELSGNYRSRLEVLESVNQVFLKIMRPEVGNINYDDDACLFYQAAYPDTGDDHKTELCMLENEETGEEKREAEARYVASRIRGMVGKYNVTEKNGTIHKAIYRDITILLRSLSDWDESFRKVLDEEGIPVIISSRTGYFSTNEIQTILNMMRVLNNPYQDIPLYGVMISCFGGFSEDEIAVMKLKNCKLYFSVLQKLPEQYRELELKRERFVEMLERYRNLSVYMPIHELLNLLLSENRYMELMSAMPQGQQKAANIQMLVTRAKDFEKTSYHGLFHFIRYIEQLVKYEVDYGEAELADENADAVRIMSIHKSKGLEFPICFLSGIGKSFNFRDCQSQILMDVDMGISTKNFYLEKRYYTDSIARNAMAHKMIGDILGEELRILYVAMTRAKEKLIITGSDRKASERYQVLRAGIVMQDDKVSTLNLTDVKSYQDYLYLALAAGAEKSIDLKYISPEEGYTRLLASKVERQQYKINLQDMPSSELKERGNQELYTSLVKRFAYQYPHAELQNLYTKTTVSEIKMAAMEKIDLPDSDVKMFEEKPVDSYIPNFIVEKEEVSGTTRGTAYHRILELLHLDHADTEEQIALQLQEFVTNGDMEDSYRTMVKTSKLLEFTHSRLAGRMLFAEREKMLYREQPFVLGLPANQVNSEFPETEMILVQGIIDVYFEEKDGLVLADYKTDRVKTAEELKLKYQAQLDYYQSALEQLTGKKVKEKIIYSFALGCEILLD